MKYYGYYLEGIFLDKFYKKDMHAVCDGKSKAFVLMCGIEGITAVRISGEASSDGKNFGGHAWNKVLLDLNGTGDKEWYFVDTTWGDVGDDSKEFLSHAYFLLSDDEVKTPTLKSRDTDTRKRKENSITSRTKRIRQAARNTITLSQTKIWRHSKWRVR